jgi:hypothetical protein
MRLALIMAMAVVGTAALAGGSIAWADDAQQKASDLPTVAVAPHTIHAVPSDKQTTSIQVTLVPLKGQPQPKAPHRDANLAPPRHYAVVKGPHARGATPIIPAPAAPVAEAVSTAPPRLFGRAEVENGTALGIDGHVVPLFGVGLAPGDGGADARAALRLKLAVSTVVCDAQPGAAAGTSYVCHDAAGADLGEGLVAQGLAVADRTNSDLYLNDEYAARAQGRGVWNSNR